MKKTTMILALAFGIGMFLSTTVQAIHPMHLTGLILNINSDISLEKNIELQDWMISLESFSEIVEVSAEQRLEVSSWMLESSWEENELEEWMLSSFNPENRAIALEDWMLSTFELDSRAIALEDWMLKIAG